MNYYCLRCTFDKGNWFTDYPVYNPENAGYKIRNAQKVSSEIKTIKAHSTFKGRLTDLLSDGKETVVSEKLKTLLQSRDNRFEFYEVKLYVKRRKIETSSPYFMINLPEYSDSLDYDKSEFDRYDDGDIFEVIQPVLKDEVEPKEIIRIERCLDPYFIREDLKVMLEKENVTGIDWVPIEQYSK